MIITSKKGEKDLSDLSLPTSSSENIGSTSDSEMMTMMMIKKKKKKGKNHYSYYDALEKV